jgi:hypothetical protein
MTTTIDKLIAKVDTLLLQAPTLVTRQGWPASKVFVHCAQSVECSMTPPGYPEQKSALFKATLGKLVFALFSSIGKMSHGLDAEIKGLPAEQQVETVEALQRLKTALVKFKALTDESTLQPHFAYGVLSKEQYALAHQMHLDNHLQLFSTVT